ncbi:MAG: hypothetical protein HY670_09245 [Chloroflexi bacterium]|nr:hypothetical protein [Chloroflexota bacterium]
MCASPGYAGRIARVDLSTGAVTHVPTETYAQAFLGGQGIAAKLYWDEVPPQVQAFDPENRLVFAVGPCAGFYGLAGARWVVCGKSPATTPQTFSHSNLGGSWGVELKSAGFDGLVVQGKAERPVYLLVQDGEITIKDGSHLWGKGSIKVREMLKGELGSPVKVVATGPAGDNMTAPATLLADDDSSGSGGLGAIMGAKNLKAIAVRGSDSVIAAQPDRLQALLEHVARLKKDAPNSEPGIGENAEAAHCTGCTSECTRAVYQARDGSRGKFMCQSRNVYSEWARKYYGQPNEVPFYANQLCDDYGLNTKSIAPIITWLHRCYEAGILTEKSTDLPLAKIGSLEFIQALMENIARRQGFGEVLAQGINRAAAQVGSQAVQLLRDDVTKSGDRVSYSPKMFITAGILYALELRQPIQQLHEVSRLAIEWVPWARRMPNANLSSSVFRAIAKRFWGSELAADFSIYEGKALASKMIQDRQLAKECLILCDNAWPILYVEHSPDHVGDPSLESQLFSAITGRDMTEEELYSVGERLFNLQRAILAREGHQGKACDTLPEASYTAPLENERLNPDCLVPGKDGQIISRKGAVLDKGEFQAMLAEFYRLRGWDPETGLQKKALLDSLGLEGVARDLAARGLLG